MLKLVASFLMIIVLGVVPAMAQSDADTDAAIDSTLGDHTQYREAFDAIQKAVTDGDKAAFAAWVSYPIEVTADGEKITISDAAQFEEQYDAVLTDEIKDAITSQQWHDLFANYQGVMFGNGQIWLNGICPTDKCETFDVKIVTIQSTAN